MAAMLSQAHPTAPCAFWDFASGATLRTLIGHDSWVAATAVTPDGRHAVSGAGDNTLRLWDLATGETLRIFTGHSDTVRAVAVTPDGSQQSQVQKTTRCAYGTLPRQTLRTLSGHSDTCARVAVTPDGSRAVSGSYDTTLRIWDLATGITMRILTGHTGTVYAVTLTSDGRLAVSCSSDNTLRIWDLAAGRQTAGIVLEAALFCVALAPDDRTIIASDESGNLWRLFYKELSTKAVQSDQVD